MEKLIIYHGSKDIIEKPYYHGGSSKNDYGFGFYCTEYLDLAKEWSCSNNENNGFANKYSIEIDNLNILDLTDAKYSILNWIAILLKHRSFDLNNEISKLGKKYLVNNFYINIENYDIVIGYRADDSYFSFARDFVNNTISIKQLKAAMELGQLGKQIVIISKKAFSKLKFEGFEMADRLEYYSKRKTRDEKAKTDYFKKTRTINITNDDLFLIDLIRKNIKNGNKNI